MIFNKLVFLKTFIASCLKTDYLQVLLLNNKLGSCHSKSLLAFIVKSERVTVWLLGAELSKWIRTTLESSPQAAEIPSRL